MFDWQPITTENIIGAAVGVVAIITMIFLILGFKESRKSSEAAQKSAEIAQQTADLALSDSKSRNRPWMMLKACEVLDNSDKVKEPDLLSLDFTNIGVMPANRPPLCQYLRWLLLPGRPYRSWDYPDLTCLRPPPSVSVPIFRAKAISISSLPLAPSRDRPTGIPSTSAKGRLI